MLTYHYIRRRGNAPSGWDTRTIWPPAPKRSYSVYPGAQYIAAGNVTFALVFAPDLTYKQRQDAIRYFEQSALKQDKQVLRAQFVGLFARRAALAWDTGLAA